MYVAIVGERCPDGAVTRLLSLPEVDEVVKLPPDRQIAEPICDHPDSLICIFEGKLYTHAEYANVAKKELSFICQRCGLELVAVDCERDSKYPLDCGFNALTLSDRNLIIGREKSLAEPLKSLPLANTNQGYAGCTALYADGTVITADPSMEKACMGIGIPVYKISGRDISLPGYNEGFIGGVHIAGYWKRDDMQSRTVFYGPDGNEIALQRGKTFICIIPDETVVSYE